ncbi:MAG: hypothetical protein HY079_03060 [Elusimicrobia bacterium]|nr:hypothetical protein [Elusimicrobiota bacterium]
MAPKVKEALSWVSEAVETAAGWAVVFVIAYALLFMDFNGNGRLVDTFKAAAREALGMAPAPRQVAVRTRVVPVRPVDEARVAQDRMFAIPEVADQEIRVPVAAADQPRPSEQITDAPADASAGGDWRKHLSTKLRTFTVYGRGETTSSASAAVQDAPASAAAKASAPTPAAPGSAARLGASTPPAARPGVSSRVSRVGEAPADSVRNFR